VIKNLPPSHARSERLGEGGVIDELSNLHIVGLIKVLDPQRDQKRNNQFLNRVELNASPLPPGGAVERS